VESKSGFLFCFVKSQRLYQAQSAPQVFFIPFNASFISPFFCIFVVLSKKKNIFFRKKIVMLFFLDNIIQSFSDFFFYLRDIYGYEKFTIIICTKMLLF